MRNLKFRPSWSFSRYLQFIDFILIQNLHFTNNHTLILLILSLICNINDIYNLYILTTTTIIIIVV